MTTHSFAREVLHSVTVSPTLTPATFGFVIVLLWLCYCATFALCYCPTFAFVIVLLLPLYCVTFAFVIVLMLPLLLC